MPGYSISVYERSGSPFWWAKCYFPGCGGTPDRWSTGVRIDSGGRRQSRRAGQAAAEDEARRRADRAAQEATADRDTSLDAVARRLIRQKIADGNRPRAVESLGGVIDKHVLPFFGKSRDIRTVKRSDLESFKRHLRGVLDSPVSVNNSLTGIRQILKYAANVDELIDELPHVPNVRFKYKPVGRALTSAQVSALIDRVDPRATEAREWLQFIANTGLRKSEALAIRWPWVDFDGGVIRIPADFRKGGEEQLAPTPMNDTVLDLLRARQARRRQPSKGRVWFQQKHDGARNSAAERAGLGRIRNHDLRHTFGSLQHAAGASLPEVRDLLGHRTLAMVNHYAHSYAGRLKEAANRVQLGPAVCPVSVPDGGRKRPGKGLKETRSTTDGNSAKHLKG